MAQHSRHFRGCGRSVSQSGVGSRWRQVPAASVELHAVASRRPSVRRARLGHCACCSTQASQERERAEQRERERERLLATMAAATETAAGGAEKRPCRWRFFTANRACCCTSSWFSRCGIGSRGGNPAVKFPTCHCPFKMGRVAKDDESIPTRGICAKRCTNSPTNQTANVVAAASPAGSDAVR